MWPFRTKPKRHSLPIPETEYIGYVKFKYWIRRRGSTQRVNYDNCEALMFMTEDGKHRKYTIIGLGDKRDLEIIRPSHSKIVALDKWVSTGVLPDDFIEQGDVLCKMLSKLVADKLGEEK